jgi:polysaccharide pyruvyl transferase WcaK-like protein/coenzyme F420-reducing hydrogenase beta subunit
MKNKRTGIFEKLEKAVIDTGLCTGCYACISSCPENCLSMRQDTEGFWYPAINAQKCTDCGLCLKVCPVINDVKVDNVEPKKSYACVNKNDSVRLESSSGGIFSLMAETVIQNNGFVFGAAFNSIFEIEHTCINKKQDIQKLRGAKYVQSRIGDIYKKAEGLLLNDATVLFCGTPCQISGLKLFLRKTYENLLCVDFICHGVSSPAVWKKYVEYRVKQAESPPRKINFRDKTNGWANFSMVFHFQNDAVYRETRRKDYYLKAYLQNICLRPSCHACRFKSLNRQSDITLADFWGIRNVAPGMNDDKGISLVMLNSVRGQDFFNRIKDSVIYKEVDVHQAILYNTTAVKSVKIHPNRKAFFAKLHELPFDKLVTKYCKDGFLTRARRKSQLLFDGFKNRNNDYPNDKSRKTMKNSENIFILAGNGSYQNRGCEAIVRGTVEILRKYFQSPRFIVMSFFNSQEEFKGQKLKEKDPSIFHEQQKSIPRKYNRYSVPWFYRGILHRLFPQIIEKDISKALKAHLKESLAVLSVGGDNYSLDYGLPRYFTAIDNIVLKHEKPLILWGASIGPFDGLPRYEKYMLRHLSNVTGIFARESETISYLTKKRITRNVLSVADPAFLLKPEVPNPSINIEKDAIGINLSPLLSKYVTKGNYNDWVSLSGGILQAIAKKTGRTIYLIPHVIKPNSNDYLFMKDVVSSINIPNIALLSDRFNAAETKYIISKMDVFAGARTHAVIAALSSCVPTLSFAYSIKAQGINKDIFGHLDYCLDKKEMKPEIAAQRIMQLIREKDNVKKYLQGKLPGIISSAEQAGLLLKQLIESSN